MWLAKKIIFHDPTQAYVYKGDSEKRKLIPNHKSLFSAKTGVGLPIGNLTSQFFANVYLNEFDHFVTEVLGIKKYIRYVDDMVLIDDDKDKLRSLVPKIQTFLKEKCQLALHPKKIRLQEVAKGVDFLGYIVKPNYILARQKVVSRLKKRMNEFENAYKNLDLEDKEDALESFLCVVSSYKGHISHANSYRLRKAIEKKIQSIIDTPKDVC